MTDANKIQLRHEYAIACQMLAIKMLTNNMQVKHVCPVQIELISDLMSEFRKYSADEMNPMRKEV